MKKMKEVIPGKDMGEITAPNLVNHNTIIVRSGLIISNSSLKKVPIHYNL